MPIHQAKVCWEKFITYLICYHSLVTNAALAPYFPERKDQHNLVSGKSFGFFFEASICEQFPFWVELLPPYISNDRLKIAIANLKWLHTPAALRFNFPGTLKAETHSESECGSECRSILQWTFIIQFYSDSHLRHKYLSAQHLSSLRFLTMPIYHS